MQRQLANTYPGGREAAVFVPLALLVVVWLEIVLVFLARSQVAIWTIYVVPAVLVVALALAWRMMVAGTARLPWGVFLAGVVFVVGGPVFDVVATLVHTPDLSLEGNPVARLLLDSGHSLRFVFRYAGFCQVAMVSLDVLLWAGLLKHRETLVEAVRGQNSFWRFLKAATGAEHLSWRQWLLPLTYAELPSAYHYVWIIAAVFVAGTIDRWYVALEWYQVIVGWRWVVVVGGMIVGLVAYFGWLWRRSREPEARA